MGFTYDTTLRACFVAYVVQAIVNNFAPLLFVTFQNIYDIPLSQITMLVTINFIVQLLVDMASARFIDVIGYRASVVAAHVMAAAGLIMLAALPELLDPFTGILIAVISYAIGGGIIEVLVSPIVEACPTEDKASAMSLLHSFYCWGAVGVVLLSTAYFAVVGTSGWRILTFLWAVIPIANGLVLCKSPISTPASDDEPGMTVRELCSRKMFWVLLAMMLCAGASELSVSQWASTFAEQGLGVSKAVGDLAGPMAFALLMGLSRALYAKIGSGWDLEVIMLISGCSCLVSYLIICLAPLPQLSLMGCALCGFSVGIMWPGSVSRASATFRRGGTAMFALLALAGDVGCSVGPTLVGMVSDTAGSMKTGILVAVVFPAAVTACLLFQRVYRKKLARRLDT